MNLFVVVSTGQKVANLPPVLEHADVGDHVVWVESEEAKRANWTTPPREVLEGYGLVTAAVVSVPLVNDPTAVANQLADLAAASRGQYDCMYLVANGGQKLSPLGLVAAFRELSPHLLYGEEKPAVSAVYPADFTRPPTVAGYTRHSLDLPDILRVNGRTFATHSRHARVWPDPAPAEWATERYGVDEAYTAELHAAHFARASVPAHDARVPFDDLPRLVPEPLNKWQRTAATLRHALNPQSLASVYNATLNLDEFARRAVAVQAVAAPVAPLGPTLEVAVARRVRAWAEATRHPAVRSVWLGVKVASESAPHVVDQEWDILLVLTNGVLFHLECKSAELDARDLDGRTHRLREAGSQLARQVCVLPVYTAHAGTPWFAALRVQRRAAEARRVTVIGFGLPGQPEQYAVPDTEPAEMAHCPPFETELARLLAPYGKPATTPAVGA